MSSIMDWNSSLSAAAANQSRLLQATCIRCCARLPTKRHFAAAGSAGSHRRYQKYSWGVSGPGPEPDNLPNHRTGTASALECRLQVGGEVDGGNAVQPLQHAGISQRISVHGTGPPIRRPHLMEASANGGSL